MNSLTACFQKAPDGPSANRTFTLQPTLTCKTFLLEAFSAYTHLSLQEMQEHPLWIINAFDGNERIIFWNDRSAEYFNIPAQQAIGKTLRDILPEEARDERVNHIKRALSGQHTILFKQRFLRKNSYYDQHLVPIQGAGKKIIAALNIVKPLD